MFREIIVPVDLTPKNESAVEVARDLALQSGGRVALLHVIETLDLPFEELSDFYDRLQERALEHMQRLAELLDRGGVPFHVHVQYGKRTDKILRFIDEHGADLVILDSHVVEPGRPGRGPTTISYRVAVSAECPVLLIKGKRGRKETA